MALIESILGMLHGYVRFNLNRFQGGHYTLIFVGWRKVASIEHSYSRLYRPLSKLCAEQRLGFRLRANTLSTGGYNSSLQFFMIRLKSYRLFSQK